MFVDYQQLQSSMEPANNRVLMAVEMSDPRDNMHAGNHLGMYNVAGGELVDMHTLSRSPSQNLQGPPSPTLPNSTTLSRHIAK